MNLIDELRLEINRAIATLSLRQVNSTDQQEKDALIQTINSLQDKLSLLNQAALLGAAQAASDCSDALEQAVAAAKKGPFDQYLSALSGHLERLDHLSAEMHGWERLPVAVDTLPLTEPVAAPSPAAGGTRDNAPIHDTRYAALKDEYQSNFDACAVRPAFAANVAYYTTRIQKGKAVYDQLGQKLGIPWRFIGIIHGMECGFDFHCHLHNGDSLQSRTVHVPVNRPAVGMPPFTWQESAMDALVMEGFQAVTAWSIPHMLYLLEKYNGFGYRMHGVPSPYLWSFSQLYSMGKYTQDGHFDPAAVSKQCGAGVILKSLA